jgi:ribonucleoside-diphosphate reductase alpha chain
MIGNFMVVHNCGEQPLPPEGSCLLGSINVALFVDDPFTPKASFNWEKYKEVVRIFTRMLDNVVEFNGLPLEGQRREIERKRRHGMGILGVGSAFSLLGIKYGSPESIVLVGKLMEVMAVTGFEVGIELAEEKGCAPIFNEFTEIHGNLESNKTLWANGKYMRRIWEVAPHLKARALQHGCRFTHHTSIAPTGTISLSVNNNVSNGIEPSFSLKYTRNVIEQGKKTKRAVDVYSYELLLYKHLTGKDEAPEWFSTSENVSTYEHVDIQAAAQYWCDSSISKTINVPSDIPFEEFKEVYVYAYDRGLKGTTTFRMNPEAFQGVLVRSEELEKVAYVFVLEDGTEIIAKGTDRILYDGEEHTAGNLFDAIKENVYGKF